MKKNKKFDFAGWATKNDLKCTDGRVIKKDAFKHNDGEKVPLVWQHNYSKPENILGHATLENRADGVYAYCVFNETSSGKNAKVLVQHGDVDSLSIHANKLKQKGNDVLHGDIKEVSLVLSRANPGALIDNIMHSDSDGEEYIDETQAIIFTGISLSHGDDDEDDSLDHEDGEETVQDVFDTLNEKQKNVVYMMIAQAMEQKNMDHSEEGGNNDMKKNIFDKKDQEDKKVGASTLTHDQFATIMETAKKNGSLKEAILTHAVDYGIEDIDVLFPDAQTLSKDPDWLKREDGWVSAVLGAIRKNPFSRIKSITADMDFATARAKGYIKATEKKETYFKMAKRVTTPTTIYVKQKLDRDDIIDVVDFDIVAMVRYQLRTLLDYELAIAALVGDGRAVEDEYKIPEENIRPIWTDDDLYVVKETLSTKTDYATMIEEIAMSGENYKGSGSPTLYTTYAHHMKMLWIKDTTGRRIYESDASLCAAMGVSAIKEIDALVGKTRTPEGENPRELIAIKVNLRDYTFGADKGGQIATFDDFDIDFNQHKYLMETRCSGCLTIPKSAQVYEFEIEN